jgi:hypothetical protein
VADEQKRVALPRPRSAKPLGTGDSTTDVLGRLEAVVEQLGKLGVAVPTVVPTVVEETPSAVVTPSEPPPARPSLPARAAKQGSRVVRWIGVVISVLTLVAQGISMLSRPENGPLVQTLMVLAAGLRGEPAPPPSELPEPVWLPPAP